MGENVYQIWDHLEQEILAWNRPNDASRQVFMARNENRTEHFWVFERQNDGSYVISNLADRNMILNVHHGQTANGNPINVQVRNASIGQRFNIDIEPR